MNATATCANVLTHCADCVDAEVTGHTIRRLFPTLTLQHLDPFVVLDELHVEPPADYPAHPHRGFEALTYVLEGDFHHRDGLGNEQLVSAGGVQRFTAGSGVPSPDMPGARGPNRTLQLWVNLPTQLDAIAPGFQQIDPSDIPEVTIEGARIRTVVGDGSPVALKTPVRYLDISLDAGVHHVQTIPAGWNGLVYVVDGMIQLAGTTLGPGQAAFPPPGEFSIKAEEATRVMLIAGRPHRSGRLLD